MAQIQDQKSCFYSQKQSVRDESGAPQYLETAGDQMIKTLVKKQTTTTTTLKEQLEIVQNFEKKSDLIPETQKGVTSLENFKKHINEGDETSTSSSTPFENVTDLMKMTGLSRHELELTLCEKPNSTVSHLYKFAISNKKVKKEADTLESKLPHHPINRLKEIEEECFGHLEEGSKVAENESSNDVVVEKKAKKRKHRKRKKKRQEVLEGDSSQKKLQDLNESLSGLVSRETNNEPGPSRPSLWDVKDMKKWSESKTYGCLPQKLYTIKDGKIVQLGTDSYNKDLT